MSIEPMSSEWQLKRIADTLDKILKVVVVTMSKEEQKKVIEILKTEKEGATNYATNEGLLKKAINDLKTQKA
jgi:hypothetical protein